MFVVAQRSLAYKRFLMVAVYWDKENGLDGLRNAVHLPKETMLRSKGCESVLRRQTYLMSHHAQRIMLSLCCYSHGQISLMSDLTDF